MLHIILTILKIIGIVLLVLLGLIMLVVLCVLFVPIRYQVQGEKTTDGYHVEAKVHWLLRLVRIKAVYPEPGSVVTKVLFFTLFDSKKEPKQKKQTSKNKKKRKKELTQKELTKKTTRAVEPQTTGAQSQRAQEQCAQERHLMTDADLKGNPDSEKEKTGEGDDAVIREKQGIFEKIKAVFTKILDFLKNIRYTIEKVCDKIKSIWTNIQYYVDVLKEEETKRAFSQCKEQLLYILKSVRPRKIKADLKIGTGSPDSTGYVLAAHGMLYPLVGNNINIEADFENKVFEGDFFIKGRITVFAFVRVAFKLFFDKDIRHLIKRFRRS